MAGIGTSKVLTGARAKLLIDGRQVGYAAGVSWSEEISQEPVDVLDRYEPYEYAPTAYRVTLQARYVRIPNESLEYLGIFPTTANDPTGLRLAILNMAEMEVQVIDTGPAGTETPVARLSRVKAMSRNLDVGPRGIVGENVVFTAIYHRDEASA